jgi:hypothetical protein
MDIPDRFLKNNQIPNIMKILPVGIVLFCASGRAESLTDGQTYRQT